MKYSTITGATLLTLSDRKPGLPWPRTPYTGHDTAEPVHPRIEFGAGRTPLRQLLASLRKIAITGMLAVLLTGLSSCNERQNYTDGPSVIDVIESVSINGKAAAIDHLSGTIQVSLPGNTDLANVSFEATAPKGVTISPPSGTTLDLASPAQVVADNGVSQRTYLITVQLLPSKIAFLGDGATIAEIGDDDVMEAARWAEETYKEDFTYISYDELSDEALNGVNVIFYVHDQVGSSAQPQVVLDKLNILSKFYVNGGKIVAGQHGTGIVEELGRDDSGLRTIIGTGEGGSNPDTWGVGFTNSTIANILTDGAVRNPDGSISVIDGGYKEDHNAMWTMDPLDAPKYATFQSRFDAEVLATWDWNVASQGTGGIIIWHPSGRFKGSIITLGIGGMEWSMNDGRTNAFGQNIRIIYKNAIDYLKSL